MNLSSDYAWEDVGGISYTCKYNIVSSKKYSWEGVGYPHKGSSSAYTIIITSVCKLCYVSKAAPTAVYSNNQKMVTVGSCMEFGLIRTSSIFGERRHAATLIFWIHFVEKRSIFLKTFKVGKREGCLIFYLQWNEKSLDSLALAILIPLSFFSPLSLSLSLILTHT